jgi:5-formyltetrahydrofolate cyclo-ligase
MIEKMSKLAIAPAVAVVGAGAALANPGGFIPIALKDISELNPSTA